MPNKVNLNYLGSVWTAKDTKMLASNTLASIKLAEPQEVLTPMVRSSKDTRLLLCMLLFEVHDLSPREAQGYHAQVSPSFMQGGYQAIQTRLTQT